MSSPTVHTFPAAHALQLVTLVRRWGITAEDLLAPQGLRESELEAPRARISLETLRELSERARTLTAEPGIGFYLGLQKRATMYGNLGFATLSAASVREGIELAVRYAPAVTTGISLQLHVDDERATILIEEHVDLGSTHDIGVFSLLVGMRQLTSTLTGRAPGRISVDIPFPKPDYFERFAHLLPDARFEQSALRIAFPARGLDVPFVMPDRAALSLAREACERELLALGFDHTLPARVRRLISEAKSFPSVEAVARGLHLSTRTLKRKLAGEGVTFTDMIDTERRERALRMLRSSELSLDAIAEHLGYSTLPNFARAFRRWTGETPATYRKRQP
jgi:AraC-like DNA-binding protein